MKKVEVLDSIFIINILGGVNMFKIGEFSKLTQVTVRMLRYYDECGLLTPAQIDPVSGYRLYSVEQIQKLNKIIYLRDSGFNVSQIADTLKIDDPALFIEQLNWKQLEIEKEIKMMQEKLKKIELARQVLLTGTKEIYYNITIKAIPSYQVISIRKIIPTYYEEGKLWQELLDAARKNQIDISGETFSIYHDLEYKETNVDVELCAPIKASAKKSANKYTKVIAAVPIMACTMVYGDFSNIAGAFLEFAAWLEENSSYKMEGITRQIVHRGPWNESNPEKYLTEIQIPLIIR